MNRTVRLISGSALTFLLIGGVARLTFAAPAEEGGGPAKLRPAQMREIEKAVAAPHALNLKVVVDARSDSPTNRAAVTKRLDAFLREYTSQTGGKDHKVNGNEAYGSFKPHGVMVLYGDPGTGNTPVPMQVGITVPPNFKGNVKEPLQIKEIRADAAIHYNHAGAYNQLRAVGPQLVSSAHMQLARTSEEPIAVVHLLTNPNQVQGGQNRAEVDLIKR